MDLDTGSTLLLRLSLEDSHQDRSGSFLSLEDSYYQPPGKRLSLKDSHQDRSGSFLLVEDSYYQILWDHSGATPCLFPTLLPPWHFQYHFLIKSIVLLLFVALAPSGWNLGAFGG